MNWRRRLREWLVALREEKRTAGRLPWLTMVQAIASGTVPRSVWRRRIRTCRTCPLFNAKFRTCRGLPKEIEHMGCGCYIPFEALAAEPYEGGCWGRAAIGEHFGWGPYSFRRRFGRLRSVIAFIRRR